ncbi:MAG: hypothetical protein R6U29_04070 [Desulfosudaceae bacterium]
MDSQKEKVTMAEAIRELVNFAVDRQDIKALLQAIPDDETAGPEINKTTLEYELPLLKIVCTGWAISYYLAEHSAKNELAQSFWMAIQEFSEKISEMSRTAAGVDINYFDLIKERADLYIQAMQMNMSEADPAGVIGITFAGICDSPEEPLVITSGKRMFSVSLESVQRYLNAVELAPEVDDA